MTGAGKARMNAPGGDGRPREVSEPPRPVRIEVAPRAVMALLLVVAGLWLLIRLWPVLLALVGALIVAGTLSPAVRWLEDRRVARGLGIAIVFTAFFVLAVLVVVLTVPTLVTQAAGLLEHEPAWRVQIADRLATSHLTEPLAGWLRGLPPDVLTSGVGAKAFAFSLRAFETVAYSLSALFLALYAMIDRDRLRGGLFAVVPRSHHIRLSRIVMNLETIVGSYIRGQMLTSLLISIFTFILLTACGVENALALAVFAGLADVLPYIGPVLSVGPAVLAALPHGRGVAIVVLVLMVAYEQFESRVLIPRIYGRALRLPSSVVLFALLAGGTLMGILGALLALPVAATLMMLVEELRVELPGEQEGAADRSLREGDDRAEEEYERRSHGVGAKQAAGIAAEISADRRRDDLRPDETVERPWSSEFAD